MVYFFSKPLTCFKAYNFVDSHMEHEKCPSFCSAPVNSFLSRSVNPPFHHLATPNNTFFLLSFSDERSHYYFFFSFWHFVSVQQTLLLLTPCTTTLRNFFLYTYSLYHAQPRSRSIWTRTKSPTWMSSQIWLHYPIEDATSIITKKWWYDDSDSNNSEIIEHNKNYASGSGLY